MSFDEIFDLTAGVYFNFYNIYTLRARSKYHTQLAKMSFDKIFDLIVGVFFMFIIFFIYNIYKVPLREVPKGVAQERNPNIQHLTVCRQIICTWW